MRVGVPQLVKRSDHVGRGSYCFLARCWGSCQSWAQFHSGRPFVCIIWNSFFAMVRPFFSTLTKCRKPNGDFTYLKDRNSTTVLQRSSSMKKKKKKQKKKKKKNLLGLFCHNTVVFIKYDILVVGRLSLRLYDKSLA